MKGWFLIIISILLIPFVPVWALAFPELTTSALALPYPRIFLHQFTGAEGILDLVSVHAAEVPSCIVTKIKSGFLLFRIPQFIDDIEMPPTLGKLGNELGANGDFFINIAKCNSLLFFYFYCIRSNNLPYTTMHT